MSFVLTAIMMFAFWMLLSGKFTFILLVSGVFSSLLVAYLSHDLVFGATDLRRAASMAARFLAYLPWLLWQIIIANLDVAYRVFHPRMPIDPCVVTFDADFETDAGMVILANSITLTPGTVTIEANKKGRYVVHAITREAAESLLSGDMKARVERIERG